MNDTAREYGGGLFALALEENAADAILEESRALTPLFTREYTHMLIDPAVPKTERISMVSEILDGRVHPYLANFVKLLTERRLVSEITGCFREYERLYYETFAIIRVRAESAVELTENQKAKLEDKLAKHTGSRIEVTYTVVPELIGGMRLVLDNRTIDSSVKTRLQEIGAVLSDTVV
ncbi:MAG: ATP synthase F1 subunit delta [Clostridia bacterium]|nr:ATP synthase F1 subunit delta [Clostridia bacterium]